MLSAVVYPGAVVCLYRDGTGSDLQFAIGEDDGVVCGYITAQGVEYYRICRCMRDGAYVGNASK